ncbi:glycosyltransferase, partial [Xanthomonas vesicatoria]|uniref:glycosyltransferase n=1 Tax=Xanthomonas vesicatoria TaxID=56460 RepID=UPI000F8F634F
MTAAALGPAVPGALATLSPPSSASPASAELGEIVVPPTGSVACIIPAYNEGATIAGTLESLLDQTRPPEAIYVVVNNSTDDTAWQARKYAGQHIKVWEDSEFAVEVHVLDIGKNAAKK